MMTINNKTGTLPKLGSDLARLRLTAGIKQADVADAMKVDTSRVSRIETGEMIADEDEVKKYAKAVGTPEAKEFAEFFAETWKCIEKPWFWHPARREITQAEKHLKRLDVFLAGPEVSSVAKAQAEMHKESILRAVAYLQNLEHSVAFVGDIGAGKSTAICAMTGLLIEGEADGKKLLRDKVVLETGAGGITICEVHVRSEFKNAFGLVVQPHAEDEVFRTVSDFCASLIDTRDGSEGGVRGVSQEVNRAIRNMSGLVRTQSKGADGKVRPDPAAELAKECNGNHAELTAEVSRRLKLDQRKNCEFRFEESDLKAGLRRLRQMFIDVNNGRCPDVSLPRRIDLIVPFPLLGKHSYGTRVIDTKGVDGTAIRPDIRAHLDDPRTLTVLCTRYNNAPDPTMQGLIENLVNTGAGNNLGERAVLLVLPRQNEALEMKDDTGLHAESAEMGYRLKQDQVLAKLSQQKGGENIKIFFFDVVNDNHTQMAKSLSQCIEQMRSAQGKRIGEVGQAVEELIKTHGEAQTKAAQEEVRRRLKIFVKGHRELNARVQAIHEQLIHALHTTNARTIWASTRRNGSWSGMDAYHYLGIGTAIDAQTRSQPIFHGLDELLANMQGDDKLSPAHDYLLELRRNIPLWREKFLGNTTSAGRELFRAVLYGNDQLWDQCAGLWGSGARYRDTVASWIRNWCEDSQQQPIHSSVEKRVQQSWVDCFLKPLATLCDALELFPSASETNS
jgi:transcriptional regulator with XRE-family HTH domain